jgi:hypothetical protein
MSIVVPAIGYVIIAMAMAVLIAPGMLRAIIANFMISDRFYIVAFLRVVFGVLFILAADG